MICLDTNAVIALINGSSTPVRARLAVALQMREVVAISIVVLFELRYGAAKSANPRRASHHIDDFLSGPIQVLDLRARRCGGGWRHSGGTRARRYSNWPIRRAHRRTGSSSWRDPGNRQSARIYPRAATENRGLGGRLTLFPLLRGLRHSRDLRAGAQRDEFFSRRRVDADGDGRGLP